MQVQTLPNGTVRMSQNDQATFIPLPHHTGRSANHGFDNVSIRYAKYHSLIDRTCLKNYTVKFDQLL